MYTHQLVYFKGSNILYFIGRTRVFVNDWLRANYMTILLIFFVWDWEGGKDQAKGIIKSSRLNKIDKINVKKRR